jgi:hypothetical protein
MKRMSILQLLLPAAIQLLGSRMKRAGEGTRAWLIYPVESSTTKTGGGNFYYLLVWITSSCLGHLKYYL